MNRWRYLTADAVGAAEGLAVDEAMMLHYGRGGLPAAATPATLRLYTYAAHCALVGRYQGLEDEIDVDYSRDHDVQVGRRPTGGGAIIMGPGQLGVAIVARAPADATPRDALRGYAEGVIAGLGELGIAAAFRAKNDLEVGGRKIAGLGLYLDDRGALLFHASVLVDLDVPLMLRILRIPGAKLSDKAAASVAERVTTVSRELGAVRTAVEVREAFARGLAARLGAELAAGGLDGEETARGRELVQDRYASREWIFQRSPQRDARGSSMLKTPEGLVRVYAAVHGEVLKSVLLTGDFNLLPPAIPRLEAALRWCRAEPGRIAAAVAQALGAGELGVPPAAVAAAIWQAAAGALELQQAAHPVRAAGSCYFPEGPAPPRPPAAPLAGTALPAAGRTSPEWVRISYASALALRFKSGRFSRDFAFGGINLLLTYDLGCRSDCGYCGLARSRAGAYEDKSFIRVEWPLVRTDELVERLARHERRLTRLCISMVTHGHAYRDTLDITRRITRRVSTPLSLLVAPPTLDEERLRCLKEAGADMIGIGLDAVTEELFRSLRTAVPKGGLRWEQYWRIVDLARIVFGSWKVNCHTLVGLGETDLDLMATFLRLLDRQIFSYLFCFNPEPDSRLAAHPKSSIRRWRRIQLAKFLLEECGLDPGAFSFDDQGSLAAIQAPADLVRQVVADGYAFQTNGCPGPGGEPGCTRPMGSWRPAEQPRDYPWRPDAGDRDAIRAQLALEEILRPGPPPSRPLERRAPPAAGRPPRVRPERAAAAGEMER